MNDTCISWYKEIENLNVAIILECAFKEWYVTKVLLPKTKQICFSTIIDDQWQRFSFLTTYIKKLQLNESEI